MDRMILYTPEVLYAVIAYYNAQVFPAQWIAAALALLTIGFVVTGRPAARWVVGAASGALWVWCGLTWFGIHYETINWAAFYYTIAFTAQGALLLFWAIFRRLRLPSGAVISGYSSSRMRAGVALALYALALHPLIEWMIGKSWAQAQYVGGSPDATVVFTLGMMAAVGRVPIWPLIVPVLWLLLSGAWSLLLGTPDRLILSALGLGFVLVVTAQGWRQRART